MAKTKCKKCREKEKEIKYLKNSLSYLSINYQIKLEKLKKELVGEKWKKQNVPSVENR